MSDTVQIVRQQEDSYIRMASQNGVQMDSRRCGMHRRCSDDKLDAGLEIERAIIVDMRPPWIASHGDGPPAWCPDCHGAGLKVDFGLIFGQNNGLWRGLGDVDQFFDLGFDVHHRGFVPRFEDFGGLMIAVVAALEQVVGDNALVGHAILELDGLAQGGDTPGPTISRAGRRAKQRPGGVLAQLAAEVGDLVAGEFGTVAPNPLVVERGACQ